MIDVVGVELEGFYDLKWKDFVWDIGVVECSFRWVVEMYV